jgi:periplasmic copper chaperone A
MTLRSLKLIAAAVHASLLLVGAPALAQDAQTYRAGSLVIETPWSRATPGGAKLGAGYMRIVNRGTEPDRLVGGSMAAARGFALHETTNVDGVARMRPVEGGLVIAPGATVDLSPGGVHVMLVDLKRPLMQGDTVEGTLVFEKAGTVSIAYRVGGIGAQNAGSSSHQHH